MTKLERDRDIKTCLRVLLVTKTITLLVVKYWYNIRRDVNFVISVYILDFARA